MMTKDEQIYHVPVLLEQSILGLNIQSAGTYVDVTFGGGGHSKEILKHLDKRGRLLSFDQDADAEKNIINDKRLVQSSISLSSYLYPKRRLYQLIPIF